MLGWKLTLKFSGESVGPGSAIAEIVEVCRELECSESLHEEGPLRTSDVRGMHRTSGSAALRTVEAADERTKALDRPRLRHKTAIDDVQPVERMCRGLQNFRHFLQSLASTGPKRKAL